MTGKEQKVKLDKINFLKMKVGLSDNECEKLLIECDWDTNNAYNTIKYFMDSLMGSVLAKESINNVIKRCGLYDKMADNLLSYSTMRGGKDNFFGFVFEEMHAAKAVDTTIVLGDNGIADFKVIAPDGSTYYAQAKAGYEKGGIDYSRYEGQILVIDRGNKNSIKRANKNGIKNIESPVSKKEAKLLAKSMQVESKITGSGNASITPQVYATFEKVKQYHNAGVSGAINAGTFAAGISTGNNFFELLAGNKELSEIVEELAKDTSRGAMAGYASSAAVSAIGSTSVGTTMLSTASTVASPVVGVVSNTALGSAVMATGSAVNTAVLSTTLSAQASLATTIAGSALGGTITGNVIFSVGSQLIAVSVAAAPVFVAGLAIGAAYGTFKAVLEYRNFNKLTEDRLERVNSIASQALAEMERQRGELKHMIGEEFEKWDKQFKLSFEQIFVATLNNNVDDISNALNTMLQVFGKSIEFKTSQEVKTLLKSKNPVLNL